jgi:hypothetical protein
MRVWDKRGSIIIAMGSLVFASLVAFQVAPEVIFVEFVVASNKIML